MTDLTEGQEITIEFPSPNIDGGNTNAYIVDTIQPDIDQLTLLVKQTKIAAVARSLETFRIIIDDGGNATVEIYLAGANWIKVWEVTERALEVSVGISETPDLDAVTYLLRMAHKVLL